MSWDDRADDWQAALDFARTLEGSDWVTLDVAAQRTGASRAALRAWYRNGDIPSRLTDGPHGPTRLVPLSVVAERAAASPRVRHATQRRLEAEAQLDVLRNRLEQLEARVEALEEQSTRAAASRPRSR